MPCQIWWGTKVLVSKYSGLGAWALIILVVVQSKEWISEIPSLMFFPVYLYILYEAWFYHGFTGINGCRVSRKPSKNGGGTISMGPVPRFWCPQIFLFVNRVSFQLWKWGGSLKKIRLLDLCCYKAIGIKWTLPNENSTNHWRKGKKVGKKNLFIFDWKEKPG